MTKKIILIFMAVLCSVSSFSQIYRSCATTEVHEETLRKDPQYQLRLRSIENHAQLFELSGANMRSMAISIPVVVHVVYNTAAQNISDAQIQSQIDVLNEDFRKLNADISSVPSIWQNITADTQIEFCLAKRDPQGNPTTGITRTYSSTISFSSNNAVKFSNQGGKDAWDRNQYMNIWVCNLGGNIAGYAQFPGGSASTDGVVVHYSTFGRTGTLMSGYNKGRVTTHEVGHWLNLRHIWGDASCGNDYVADTPTQSAANYGCPVYPNVTCSNGPHGDMYMNYMDYTFDACKYMFTNGQSTRMNAILAPGGFRYSLSTSLGCIPPGSGTVCNTPTGLTASPSTSTATLSWSGTGATSYSVRYKPVAISNWTTLNSSQTSISISGLTAGTTYEFQVQSICSSSSSTYSNSSNFTTSGAICNVPSGLTIINISTSFVTASWNSTGASSYVVRYKPTTSQSWSSLSTTLTSISIGGLSTGISYELQVQGICGSSSSSFSSSTTFIIPVICNMPGGLSISNISTSSATLAWSSTGATSYNIKYKSTSSNNWISTNTSQTNIFISGLTSGTTYEFQVQSVCGTTNSSFSESAIFSTSAQQCNIPSGLQASNVTTSTTVVTWNSTGASSYNLRYKANSATNWSYLQTSQTNASLGGLLSGINYEFQVQSICGTTSSGYSSSAFFTTLSVPCNTPTGLSAGNITSTNAQLFWNNSGANTYNIRYKATSSSIWNNLTTSQTSVSLSGLTPGISYEFQVQGLCSNSSSAYSPSVNFLTTTICNSPANLFASNIASTSALLSWSSTGAVSYNLRYKPTSSSSWINQAITQTNITVSGLSSGVSYEFQVQSICTANSSIYSGSLTFTTLIPLCNIPGGLSASNITTSTANLHWNSTGASLYSIRYKISSSSTWNNFNTTQTSVNIGGLLAGTNYDFQVQGYCGTMWSGYGASEIFVTASPACPVPGGLTIGSMTSTSAVLSWASTGATSYVFRYKAVNNTTWTSFTSMQTSIFLSGLIAGATYEFQVQSNCSGNMSAFSNSTVFITTAEATVCSEPNNLNVINITNTTATLTWSSTNATYYYLRYKTVSGLVWSNIITSQTSISLGGLQAGTPYEFQVQSVCDNTSSAYSESVLFTTTAPFCVIPTGLSISAVSNSTVNVNWVSTGSSSYYLRYKSVSSFIWSYAQTTSTNVNLGGLSQGTQYEVQVQSSCGTTASAYSASVLFTTLSPSCVAPSNLTSTNISTSSLTLTWTATGANSYTVRYKPIYSTLWSTLGSNQTFVNIGGLLPNTSYELQVQSTCGTTTSGYSQSVLANTSGNNQPANTITVGTGTALNNLPYGTGFQDERVQFFISKAELDAAGFNSINNRLTSLGFYVATASNQVMNNFTIKIAHVSTASFANSYFVNTFGATSVFSGNVTAIANSWNTHVFTNPFIYNGINNVLIEICFDNSSSSFNSMVRYSVTSQPTVLYTQQNINNGGLCTANPGTLSNNRPNMRFGFNGSDSRFTSGPIIDVESAHPSVSVFPNPASTEAFISYTIFGPEQLVSIDIIDLSGRIIYQENIIAIEGVNKTHLQFDNNINPGIYFVRVTSDKEELVTKLIVN